MCTPVHPECTKMMHKRADVMADEELPERKESTERRVYTLPANLLERLRAFQMTQGISSEAEAARRLLDTALQMRDGVTDILRTLQAKFVEEKDLRVLASEILVKHILVKKLHISDVGVEFELTEGNWGRFDFDGDAYWRTPSDDADEWRGLKRSALRAAPLKAGPPWEPTDGGLDDEIPF
jgi:hypothetical protein